MKKRIMFLILILILLFLGGLTWLYFNFNLKPKGTYTIKNETKECPKELTKIGEDHSYVYYLNCVDLDKTFLVYENKAKITLKEALKTNKITIKEIEKQLKENFYALSKKQEKYNGKI